MYSKWLEQLGTARAWIFGAATVVIGIVWLFRH